MPKADATIKKMVFKEDTYSRKIAIGIGRGRKNHSHAENKYCFSARRRRLMQGLWKSYARKAGYAKGIAFDDVVDSIGRLIKTVI